MSARTLHVFKAGVRVARLEADIAAGRRLRTRLVYTTADPRQAVSLILPVRERPYVFDGLPPVLEQCLPQGRRRLAVSDRVVEYDDVGILEHVGGRTVGDITVGAEAEARPEGGAALSPSELADLDRKRFKTRLLADDYRDGVGGTQSKLLVDTRDIEGQPPCTEHWLVKSPGHSEPSAGMAENEFFCLRAAERAGLGVPASALSEDATLLRVKRIERNAAGEPCSFEEVNALLGHGNTLKYNASLERVGRLVRTHVSPRYQCVDLRRLFQLNVFNMLIGNADAHLKRLALITPPGGAVRLAPFYGVTCTRAHEPGATPALHLDGVRAWPAPRQLVKFGVSRCLLSRRAARQAVQAVIEGVGRTLLELEAYTVRHPGFADTGRAMSAIWRREISKLAEALSLAATLPAPNLGLHRSRPVGKSRPGYQFRSAP